MSEANTTHELQPRTETFRPRAADGGVTIHNNIGQDVLLCVTNAFWGFVSAGYARAGNSVTLPTIVNVDAFALFQYGSAVFIEGGGSTVNYHRKKINLTPGRRRPDAHRPS